jgi:hypothetical protein
MHRKSSQRLTAAFAAAAALYLAAPTPASAQARELKTWPAQGAWHTTLIERPNGAGYMCMLNGIGRDPHGFGISIIEMPGHLMFAVDDRNSKQGYMPTMAVSIDGAAPETFDTFNDPPMTSTAPNDATKVKVLIDRLAQGQNLTVDARRAQYKLSLDGFSTAAQQLVACRQEMASRQQGTVGERQ